MAWVWNDGSLGEKEGFLGSLCYKCEMKIILGSDGSANVINLYHKYEMSALWERDGLAAALFFTYAYEMMGYIFSCKITF